MCDNRNIIQMSRIRTIQPHFPRSPSMSRVSREARLLFVLLWTVVDDEGRCHAALDDLATVLYPSDFDASMYLLGWLDELEREDCIERYEIDDMDYLRIVHWQKHQRVYHPTQSYLPPPPHEGLDLSGIREASGKLQGRDGKTPPDQRLGARSDTVPEKQDFSADDSGPIVVTNQHLLREIQRARADARADRSHTSVMRSIAMEAQIGLTSNKVSKGKARDEPAESSGPSLAELHGMNRPGE
jgi:hypothetical protein